MSAVTRRENPCLVKWIALITTGAELRGTGEEKFTKRYRGKFFWTFRHLITLFIEISKKISEEIALGDLQL